MKINFVKRALSAAVIGALFVPSGATAATSTGTFLVTVTVASSCTITATTLNFGTYDGANTNATTALNGAGSVSATCTQGSVPTIALGPGGNAAGTQRRMKDATTDYLTYNLLQPPNNTPGTACNYATGTAWGDGTAATAGTVLTLTAAPSNTARTYNTCGVIPAGQNVPINGVGNLAYNDTVTATITF